MALTPQPVDEARLWCVEVEETDRRPRRPEAVLDVRRHRDEGAGTGLVPFASEEELDLPFEHVERVRVVGVGVWIDTLEVRRKGEIERLDVRQLREHTVLARPDPLALAGTCEERLLHRCGS